jgi:DNA-binding IclR family transcriptional regulator
MNAKQAAVQVPVDAPRLSQVRAVARAMAVLAAFESAPRLSLADITKATELDKGTVRRLLATLVSGNFVTYDAVALQYSLGGRLRRITARSLDSMDVRSLAVPALHALATELSVSAYLSVYQDGCAICLERIHDINGFVERNWKVGGTMPLNCGGAPKVLLAYQAPQEIERGLLEPIVQMTPNTIMSREQLRRRLTQIRKRGWELAIDDVVVGLSTLAAPLLDAQGAIRYAVSISGLTPQLVSRGRPLQLERFLEVTQSIRQRLEGYFSA